MISPVRLILWLSSVLVFVSAHGPTRSAEMRCACGSVLNRGDAIRLRSRTQPNLVYSVGFAALAGVGIWLFAGSPPEPRPVLERSRNFYAAFRVEREDIEVRLKEVHYLIHGRFLARVFVDRAAGSLPLLVKIRPCPRGKAF